MVLSALSSGPTGLLIGGFTSSDQELLTQQQQFLIHLPPNLHIQLTP